jgi:hypothetical protein
LLGAKNGRKFGIKSNIVAINAEILNELGFPARSFLDLVGII